MPNQSGPVTIRLAVESDLAAIVRLLTDDPLGAGREQCGETVALDYVEAFAAIDRQDGNHILVCERAGQVIGCLQLTFIPGLSRRGMLRAQIEGVRVATAERGQGIGARLFEHAFVMAERAGCGLVQLTSDLSRPDAHRFYARLGFTASHAGFKRPLPRTQATELPNASAVAHPQKR